MNTLQQTKLIDSPGHDRSVRQISHRPPEVDNLSGEEMKVQADLFLELEERVVKATGDY